MARRRGGEGASAEQDHDQQIPTRSHAKAEGSPTPSPRFEGGRSGKPTRAQVLDGSVRETDLQDIDEERFPNLAALRRGQRQQNVLAGRAAGLDRKQASRHADEHLPDGS